MNRSSQNLREIIVLDPIGSAEASSHRHHDRDRRQATYNR
jgi:hypothetical protein